MDKANRLADFDYPSEEVLENPFPFYKALREDAPVHQIPSGAYMITRYEDVVAIARQPELFSSHIGPSNPGLNGDYGLDVDTSGRFTPWQAPFSDPPEHRLKRALGQQLTVPRRLRSFEPIIEKHVDALIDGFIDKGEADFKAQFADKLPVLVVNEIFGLETQPRPAVALDSSGRKMTGGGVGSLLSSPEQKAALKDQARERAKYYREVILDRLENPRDDYASHMVQMKMERDGELDLAYLTVELMNFHGAGIGTTAHMLASAMTLLLQHPDEVEMLRADPSRAGRVIDEALRLECPVQWLQRVVMQDTEIHGAPIKKGDYVLLVWAAANRDPSQFEDPDRFWPDRPGAKDDRIIGPVAFGHGIHTCIGGPLARVEGKTSLNRMLARTRNLRLTETNDFQHILDMNHRAPLAVHVAFDQA